VSAGAQWDRLLDPGHIRAGLVDIAAFLTAAAVVEDHLVGLVHGLLAEAERVGGDPLDERDVRIAHSDPTRPADALADTVAWLTDMQALTDADGERLLALLARRDQIARAPHRALIDRDAGELLTAVIDLRELLHNAARWWYVNVAATGLVDEDTEIVSMAEAVLGYIIDVAQETALP
jgi:hypothetical protein